MAAAALQATNAAPSDDDIKQAIPNLCRCGVYPRLVRAIQRAARVAARPERISAAPAPGISPEDAAAAVPAMRNDTEKP
jgi:isoquinoline 1-oxidoreductase alpha subunit